MPLELQKICTTLNSKRKKELTKPIEPNLKKKKIKSRQDVFLNVGLIQEIFF